MRSFALLGRWSFFWLVDSQAWRYLILGLLGDVCVHVYKCCRWPLLSDMISKCSVFHNRFQRNKVVLYKKLKLDMINVKFLLLKKLVLIMWIFIHNSKVKNEQWRSLKSALIAAILCWCIVCLVGTEGSRTWELQKALIKSVLVFLVLHVWISSKAAEVRKASKKSPKICYIIGRGFSPSFHLPSPFCELEFQVKT